MTKFSGTKDNRLFLFAAQTKRTLFRKERKLIEIYEKKDYNRDIA